MSGLGLTFLRRGGLTHPTAGSDYLMSERKGDQAVFQVLMSKGVSSDGVGITKEDVAKVKSINGWFANNTDIKDFKELQFFTGITDIGHIYNSPEAPFINCTSLERVILPPTTTTIGNSAFKGCTSLAECDIPQSVQRIGGSAFTGTIAPLVINCPNLTLLYSLAGTNVERVINLGTLATIPEKCFYQCYNLKSLILPASLTTRIQAYAFMDCTSLEYAICHMDAPTPSYRDIFTNTNNCPIYVPDASVDAYKAASVWSGYASRIKPLSEFNG